jgi:hypothetical protein
MINQDSWAMLGPVGTEGLATMDSETLIRLLHQMQTHQLQLMGHPANQQAYSKDDRAELTSTGRSPGLAEEGGLCQCQTQANAMPGLSQKGRDKQTLAGNGGVDPTHASARVAADMNQNAEQRLSHMSTSKMNVNKDDGSLVEAMDYRQLLHQIQASVAIDIGQNEGQRLVHQLLHQMLSANSQASCSAEEVEEVAEEMRSLEETMYVNTME